METLVIVYFSTNLNLRSVTALTFFWIVYSLITRTSFCVHITHYIVSATTFFEWNFHMLILLYGFMQLPEISLALIALFITFDFAGDATTGNQFSLLVCIKHILDDLADGRQLPEIWLSFIKYKHFVMA